MPQTVNDFCLFVYLGFLRRFQHCTGHITTGSWKGRGNQYIEFARVVYCKLPTNGKQLPAFPLTTMTVNETTVKAKIQLEQISNSICGQGLQRFYHT